MLIRWLSGSLLQEPPDSAATPTPAPAECCWGNPRAVVLLLMYALRKLLFFFQSAAGISHVCYLLQCRTGRAKLKVAGELHESVEYRNSSKRKDALLDTHFWRKVGHLLCLRKDWERRGARFTSLASLGDRTKKVETALVISCAHRESSWSWLNTNS